MTISLNLANDYKVITDPVTLTLQSKTGNGTYPSGSATYAAGISVPYCARSKVTKEDQSTDPALLAGNAVAFDLWTANLSGTVPKIGDLLTDELSVVNVIRSVQACDQDSNGIQRYHCACLQSTVVEA